MPAPTLQILALCFATAPAAEPPVVPTPVSETARADRFDLALFRTAGLDSDALGAELRLRMPAVTVQPHAEAGDLSGRDAPYLYLETTAESDRVHSIAVIVSDGRAYYGEVAVDEGLRAERVVASTLANLIFSIEQGTVAPDRQDATIPPSEDSTPAVPAPEKARAEPSPAEPAPPSRAEPRLEIAFTPYLGNALALGPPSFGDVYLGFGGGVGVELRARRGAHAFADFRAIGRSDHDHRLTRLRVSLGAGFAWRGNHLELVTDLGLAVEPWIVSTAAGVADIRRDDGVAAHPPVLSAFLRLSPGYRATFDKGAIRALRVGPRVEVTAGFVPYTDPAIGVAQLRAPNGEPLFRLGGAEVMTGLALALWFAAD